jgi:RsiW-degrading membrane proteinase PrsW (M82 family)
MITEAYLGGAITFGSMIAGLTSGAGVGVMYLFKRNHNIKQNLGILVLMFLIGAVSGLLLQIIM